MKISKSYNSYHFRNIFFKSDLSIQENKYLASSSIVLHLLTLQIKKIGQGINLNVQRNLPVGKLMGETFVSFFPRKYTVIFCLYSCFCLSGATVF